MLISNSVFGNINHLQEAYSHKWRYTHIPQTKHVTDLLNSCSIMFYYDVTKDQFSFYYLVQEHFVSPKL